MGSWGDVNVALNRLVREGVITSFRTNLAQPDRSEGLHVVAASDAFEGAAVEAVRERVTSELARVVGVAKVTIEPTAPAPT